MSTIKTKDDIEYQKIRKLQITQMRHLNNIRNMFLDKGMSVNVVDDMIKSYTYQLDQIDYSFTSVEVTDIEVEIEDNQKQQYKTSEKVSECDRLLSCIKSMRDYQLDDSDAAAIRKLEEYRSKLSTKFIELQASNSSLYNKRNLVLLHEFKYE